jgi:uncharacterized protein (TIGR02599 family)
MKKIQFSPDCRSRCAAFTLVEMLVSTAIVALLVVMLAGILQQTSTVWSRTTGKIEQFREARGAFENMTLRISQATLNTYWDYQYVGAGPARTPQRYMRRSELRFISGPVDQLIDPNPTNRRRLTHATFFQAPLGVVENVKYKGFENLLCTWGYFVEVGGDLDYRPRFLDEELAPQKHRSRLIETWVAAERNLIYRHTSGVQGSIVRAITYSGKDWFRDPLNLSAPPVHVLAENILALVLTPRLAPEDEEEVLGTSGRRTDLSPLAPNYLYDTSPVGGANPADSRHSDGRLNPVAQLPPVIQVTMVAIDEASALRSGPSALDQDPFLLADRFKRSADYSKDLLRSDDSASGDSLEDRLIEARANYRIFTTNVIIRGSKWSREQTN